MLLSYAFTTQPDPLAASGSADLTLGVSNLSRHAVTVTSITVTLPVGTAAKDLTANPSGITTVPPAGWTIAQDGGAFTLTPDPGHASVATEGLAFVFAGVVVNAQPGPCEVTIDELAGSPPHPAEPSSTKLPLAKFPAGFTLSTLTASRAEVPFETGTVQLGWTGAPATYTLQYDPDGKALITQPVANSGPLGVTGLINPNGIVAFTLNAEWTAPGHDRPCVAQRHVTVGITPRDPVITSFTGTPVERQVARAEGTAASPLLTYAVLTDPEPFRVSRSAALTLAISNGTRQTITAESITLTLPVGTNAKMLTANASGIATSPPAGWNVTQSGGTFTLAPKNASAGKIEAAGLVFLFKNIAVNDQPGTCVVILGETASAPSQPSAYRTAPIALSKFPAQFEVGQLTATPTQVAPGGSAMLLWRGSPATYTLAYDPNGAEPVRVPVGNNGPYTALNLTKSPSVTFTLEASVTVPGQDQPLVMQRQVTVDVSTSAPVIAKFTGTLRGGFGWPIVLDLAWSVRGNAVSCSFDDVPYAFSPEGSIRVPSATVPQLSAYTLHASNGSGRVAAALDVRWTARQTTIALAEPAENIAVAKTGARAYACTAHSVVALDLNRLQVAQPAKAFADALAFVTLSPDGTRLYATAAQRKTVTVLDAQTLETLGPPIAVSVAPQPTAAKYGARAAISPDGSRLFIPGGYDAGLVSVVDTVTRTERAALRIPYAIAAAVTPDGKRLFVSTLAGTVYVLDAVSLDPIGEPIPAGKDGAALVAAADGTRVYLLDQRLAEIIPIDAATHEVGRGTSVPHQPGNPPRALAITPGGAQLLCGATRSLTLLQSRSLRMEMVIAMPSVVRDIAVSEDTKLVLMAVGVDRGSVVAYAPPYVAGGVPSQLTFLMTKPS